jgi:phage-related holin
MPLDLKCALNPIEKAITTSTVCVYLKNSLSCRICERASALGLNIPSAEAKAESNGNRYVGREKPVYE